MHRRNAGITFLNYFANLLLVPLPKPEAEHDYVMSIGLKSDFYKKDCTFAVKQKNNQAAILNFSHFND